MQALHCGIISIPGSPKPWTWKLPPIPPTQITENLQIVSKVGSTRLAKSSLKSIKTDIWAPVCPLGVLLAPEITKTVSQVPKIEPEGIQNDEFEHKKRPIAAINLSAAASCQGEDGLRVVIGDGPMIVVHAYRGAQTHTKHLLLQAWCVEHVITRIS